MNKVQKCMTFLRARQGVPSTFAHSTAENMKTVQMKHFLRKVYHPYWYLYRTLKYLAGAWCLLSPYQRGSNMANISLPLAVFAGPESLLQLRSEPWRWRGVEKRAYVKRYTRWMDPVL